MTSPSSPREPAHGLRASDADRERVAEALRGHHVDGRLDTDELQERLERCYAARTSGELEPLLADMPREERPQAHRPGAAWPGPPLLAILIVVGAAFATVGAFAHGHPNPFPIIIAFLLLRFVVWGGPRRRFRAWGQRV